MTIDKAITEILFRSLENQVVFIKMSAINRGSGGKHVYTTYGIVENINRETIYFSYKKTARGQEPLSDDTKKYEYYRKSEFEYDITFIEDFNEKDFLMLIDLTLLETFPLPVYNSFKSFFTKIIEKNEK